MCNEAVEKNPYLLGHVPDWFVTQEQVKIWYDEVIGWYKDYKKRKAQKV